MCVCKYGGMFVWVCKCQVAGGVGVGRGGGFQESVRQGEGVDSSCGVKCEDRQV